MTVTPIAAARHPIAALRAPDALRDRKDDRRTEAEYVRMDLRVHRAETIEFAAAVRARGLRVHYATVAERPDVVLHDAAAIVSLADRVIARLGGDAA